MPIPSLIAALSLALAEPPPNFVVVFTDDQGYGDLGCYGAEGFETPQLDRMAAEGLRFTDFYVGAPVCTPSRAALLTGCYPTRVGLGHRVLFPFSETGLAPSEQLLPEVLAEVGYASACIGKWHLGHHEPFLPLAQGFDEFFGVPYSNDMDGFFYGHRNFQSPPLPLYRDRDVVESGPEQSSLTRRFADAAVDFIARHRDRPFFLYVAPIMPHQPIAASPAFRGRSEAGTYGDVIEEIDDAVGRILAALRRHQLDGRTWVVFSSDNGPWRRASAGPLRGKKNTTWEGGLRVPFVVRGPGVRSPGASCRHLLTAMDLLPSFAAMAGAALPAAAIDGVDASAILCEGDAAPAARDTVHYWRDDRLQAVRHGDFKLHVHRPEWNQHPAPPMLYDLRQDPGETRDIAAERPELVAELTALADEAAARLGDAVRGAIGRECRPVGRLDG